MSSANPDAHGLLVDLDPINIKWTSSGDPEDIKAYLENVQTAQRTEPLIVHSSENTARFEKSLYIGILTMRTKGGENRLRAVLQSTRENFISEPVDVMVGLTVLTVGEKPGLVVVAAMIDNRRVPFYDFQAKIVVPPRISNREPLSIGPNIAYQFKPVKVLKPRELDWTDAKVSTLALMIPGSPGSIS